MAGQFTNAVERHNEHRARHGSPALVWDDTLAYHAAQFASRGVFAHDTGLLSRLQEGENLAHGYASAEAAVDGFYSEIRHYDYNNPVFSMATGHFTQVVWRGSRRIGIAVGNYNGSPLYVFRYSPSGNMAGDFQANVLPPRSGASNVPRPLPAAGRRLVVRAWYTHTTEGPGQGSFAVYLQAEHDPRAIASAQVDYNHPTFEPAVLGMARNGQGIWMASRRSWGLTTVLITFTLGDGSRHTISLDCPNTTPNSAVEYALA